VSTDLATWYLGVLDDLDATARKAAAEAPAPWTNDEGLVKHAGPKDLSRDGGLWDSEGTREPHPLCMEPEVADHVAENDPATVLADIEVKRAIVEMLDSAYAQIADPYYEAAQSAVRLLAYPHRDRPGYRPEWAPEDVTV
jgi:hypothetical protein